MIVSLSCVLKLVKLSKLDKANLKYLEMKKDLEGVTTLIKGSSEAADLLLKVGAAYYGARAFRNAGGAFVGLIALRLAQSNNLAAGLSGVGTLASIGLAQPGVIEGVSQRIKEGWRLAVELPLRLIPP